MLRITLRITLRIVYKVFWKSRSHCSPPNLRWYETRTKRICTTPCDKKRWAIILRSLTHPQLEYMGQMTRNELMRISAHQRWAIKRWAIAHPHFFHKKCALTYLTQMRSNYPLFQSAHLVSDMSKIKKDSARCLREYLRYETNTSQRARKQNNTITHLFLVSDHSSFFWNYCVFYRKTHKYINEHK